MKVLFIGGTGNISGACTRHALENSIEVFHLNRGNTDNDFGKAVKVFRADIHDEEQTRKALKGHTFDVIVNFIAYVPGDIERDFRLFNGKTSQYVFISSASIYQKPPSHPVITESTPLKNPYWQYSRDKIECELLLNRLYREKDFPVTIVRPSLTYETVIPAAIGSWDDFTLINRIREGKKIIVHGDGTSIWTITHSADFAAGFTGLLGHQQALGHSFHITSDELLTWNQIYKAIGHAAGREPVMVHIPSEFIARFDTFQVGNLLGDKAHSAIFDNSKIKSFVPGYSAKIPFRTGIGKTVEWMESRPGKFPIREKNNQFMDHVIQAYDKLND